MRFLLGGRVRLIALLAVAFAAVAALPAAAKVPGSNGRIVFARVVNPDTDHSITYTANPDGSHVQQLFSADFSGNPRWSPDGSRVAVLSAAGKPCCTVASVIVNPDDGSYQVLQMPDPTLFTGCVVWSPDAKRLACDGESDSDPSRNGIYTIRTSDGGGLTRITNAGAGGGVDVIDVPIDYSPMASRSSSATSSSATPARAIPVARSTSSTSAAATRRESPRAASLTTTAAGRPTARRLCSRTSVRSTPSIPTAPGS